MIIFSRTTSELTAGELNQISTIVETARRSGVPVEHHALASGEAFVRFADGDVSLSGAIQRLDQDLRQARGMVVRYRKVSPTAFAPERATKGAAGADLRADIGIGAFITINPGQQVLVKTGLAFEVPDTHYLRVAPRSGLSLQGVIVGGGVVDADYRGNVGVILINANAFGAPVAIKHGDSIAQAIFERIDRPLFQEASELTPTERGDRGFGSTGR